MDPQPNIHNPQGTSTQVSIPDLTTSLASLGLAPKRSRAKKESGVDFAKFGFVRSMYTTDPPIPVTLLPTQIEAVGKLIEILNRNAWALNSSKMGAGKTPMTAYMEQHFRFPYMIVICPAGLEEQWKADAAKYGLPLTMIMTYESLAGRKDGVQTHGLIIRTIEESKKIYTPTQTFIEMCKAGLFLVFDEMQKIKNKSENQQAAACLTSYITSTPLPSRVLYLSGSPFDKEEQIIDFMRYNSIIRHRNLYMTNKELGTFELQGANDLLEYARRLNERTVMEILDETPFTKSNVVSVCAKLYYKIIEQHLSAAAPTPKSGGNLDAMNGYFNMSKRRANDLKHAIADLQRSARFNESNGGSFDAQNANWGGITSSLVAIEAAKIEIFVRYADYILSVSPTAKVCIMVNFNGAIDIIPRLLAHHNPLILNGAVQKSKRRAIANLFQQHNTNHRLLISNIVVTAYGYNLDDTDGRFERYFLISPGYKAMVLHQATFRGLRPFTKSTSHVVFVFGKCGTLESSILNVLARKKDVMKASVKQQIDKDPSFKFPGEYPNWEEPDGNTLEIDYDEKSALADEREEDADTQSIPLEDSNAPDGDVVQDVTTFSLPSILPADSSVEATPPRTSQIGGGLPLVVIPTVGSLRLPTPSRRDLTH